MVTPLILLGIIVFALLVIFYFVPLGLWIQGIVSVGLGKITIIDLIRMRLRKIPPRVMVDSIINLNKAGLESISTGMVETHFLAGGNVPNVSIALIAADKARIPLDFATCTAIDLAGRDVKGAVETSVYPKVIDAPVNGTLAAVAKDGIEVKARARVTVRTNIPGLVGGATDETIIARVGEGIVSAIGSSDSYKRKGWTPARRLRFSVSILPMWMWARTSGRIFRPIRPRPILGSPRREPKRAAPWPLRRNRR